MKSQVWMFCMFSLCRFPWTVQKHADTKSQNTKLSVFLMWLVFGLNLCDEWCLQDIIECKNDLFVFLMTESCDFCIWGLNIPVRIFGPEESCKGFNSWIINWIIVDDWIIVSTLLFVQLRCTLHSGGGRGWISVGSYEVWGINSFLTDVLIFFWFTLVVWYCKIWYQSDTK